jgi:signal transduction histidine kinase
MSLLHGLQLAAIALTVLLAGFAAAQRHRDPARPALLLFLLVQLGWLVTELVYHSPLSVGREKPWHVISTGFWIPIGLVFLLFVHRLLVRRLDWVFGLLAAATVAALAAENLIPAVAGTFERTPWRVTDYRHPVTALLITAPAVGSALYGLVLIGLAARRTPVQALRHIYVTIGLGAALTLLLSYGLTVLSPALLGRAYDIHLGSLGMSCFGGCVFLAMRRYDFLVLSSEQVAAGLFAGAPDGILILDASGRLSARNDAAIRLLDQPLPPGDLLPDGLLGRLLAAAGTGAPLPPGEASPGRAIRVTASGDGASDRLLLLRDVTAEWRAAELLRRSHEEVEREIDERVQEIRQAQRLEAMGTLAGSLSHDLNNLLGIMLGFADALRRRLPADHPAREDLEAVIGAARRTHALVQQLLAFSRRTPAVRATVPVQPIVQQAVELLAATLAPTVRLETRVSAEPLRVHVDERELLQVLMNLCTNGIQALPDQTGTLRVTVEPARVTEAMARTHPPLEPGDHVRLAVTDSGTGMTGEVRRQLFRPFFTTRETGQGTGLGLVIALRLVTASGGALQVETEPAAGSTFTVLLPLAPPDPTPS